MKRLGVELDYQLNFNEQTSRIRQKVARQLNVFQMISKFLSEERVLLSSYLSLFFLFYVKVDRETIGYVRRVRLFVDSLSNKYLSFL